MLAYGNMRMPKSAVQCAASSMPAALGAQQGLVAGSTPKLKLGVVQLSASLLHSMPVVCVRTAHPHTETMLAAYCAGAATAAAASFAAAAAAASCPSSLVDQRYHLVGCSIWQP